MTYMSNEACASLKRLKIAAVKNMKSVRSDKDTIIKLIHEKNIC